MKRRTLRAVRVVADRLDELAATVDQLRADVLERVPSYGPPVVLDALVLTARLADRDRVLRRVKAALDRGDTVLAQALLVQAVRRLPLDVEAAPKKARRV